MQLLKKYEISSKKQIIDFINNQPVGRISSIDSNGYPQVIPMNFVYVDDAVYMHSHPFGEKIDNIRKNPKVGFEVDQHVCFLPSYYFHPTNASQADTLYISVVIKGTAFMVEDNEEKARALNALMEKYQKEGRYERLDKDMPSVHEVAVIKVVPKSMRGKYKVGQHWASAYRLKIANHILKREGLDQAKPILAIMGVEVWQDNNGTIEVKEGSVMQ